MLPPLARLRNWRREYQNTLLAAKAQEEKRYFSIYRCSCWSALIYQPRTLLTCAITFRVFQALLLICCYAILRLANFSANAVAAL